MMQRYERSCMVLGCGARALPYLRPMVEVAAVAVDGGDQGHLYCMVGVDASGASVPLVCGHAMSHDAATWTWFMTHSAAWLPQLRSSNKQRHVIVCPADNTIRYTTYPLVNMHTHIWRH